MLADLGTGFDPVHDWHVNVENDDAEVRVDVTFHQVERILAILDRHNKIEVLVQAELKRV